VRRESAKPVHAEPARSPERLYFAGLCSRTEAYLFSLAFITFAFFYQGADQSTAARFDLMRSLVERRTLWIDGYCGYNTADIISLYGHYYSVKAPGGSFTGLIQWIFFSLILWPLKVGHEALYWALTTWLTIIFSTSLLVAFAAVLMYRLVILLTADRARAIICAVVLPFGTIMFPYATEMTGEPIAAAACLLAFYLLVSERTLHDAGRAMVAGAAAGWAVLCDFPTVLIAVALAAYALWRLGPTLRLVAFAGGAGAIALLLFAYNLRAFGSPFFLSYEAYKLAGNSQFPEQAVGFVGLTYPRPAILYKILLDPQRGLFYCNPVLILSLFGVVGMAKRRKLRAEFLIVVSAAISMILFNSAFGASIVSWGGGTATGPRQIVAAIPFLVLPLAFLPRGAKWWLLALGFLSAFLMLMATAVEPHFPYEYGNPLRDFIWPAYLRGDLAYNSDAYFGGPPIVDESTAFNLGKLARLPGAIALLPLAALWLWGAAKLMGDDGFKAVTSTHRAAVYCAIGAMFLPPLLGPSLGRLRAPSSHGLMARYYRGLEPNGFPPHIERVDRELDFGSVAELGALPAPSRIVWSGTLLAPISGRYRFAINVDDSGWLNVDGRAVIRDPGEVTQGIGEGTVVLTAGPHRVEAGERNLAGDAAMRLLWQPPGAAELQVIPSTALLPH